MPFGLHPLAFEYNALEPHFDATSLKTHYNEHFIPYLDTFNESIKNTELEDKPCAEIFARVSEYPAIIRNNGGGYFNHTFFWNILTPYPKTISDIVLSDAIIKYFGTLENLKEEFAEAALAHFGSGWTWLIKKNNGELIILSTSNHDNPLMDTSPVKGKPILCLDLWEHAYYLQYRSRRADYIKAFWNVVNWHKVAELFKNQKSLWI
jgi:superoxide dismutase, Fe-Mn family